LADTRRRGRGFTLTEILMAVGILGVGLSMIAAVFPIAVDQDRRGRESTMAALCARSVVASMRAGHSTFAYDTHTYFGSNIGDATRRDIPTEYDASSQSFFATTYPTTPSLPKAFREYNPTSKND